MAVSFQFKSNSKQVNAKLATMVSRQVPFATAKSLTLTSKSLVEQNKRDTTTIFSNPTAWTKNAFFFIPAKKNNPRTIIKRKDRAGGSNASPSKQHYLEVQQQGGGRGPKAFENALRLRGRGAGGYRYATPTRDTRLNAAGNMTRNQINKIIAGVSQKGGKYFIPKPNHPLAIKGGAGVFERMAKNKVKKRLHLTNTIPNYRAQFRFYKRMTKYGKMAFPRIFRAELKNALRTSGFR